MANVTGTADDDIRLGTSANDNINVLAGNDIVLAGAGNDNINGGNGNDLLFGEAGNDTINGGSGSDIILGEAGNDVLNGDNGDDIVLGGSGNDVLNGNNGDDVLLGGSGNDNLLGNSGSDRLVGGAGNDNLTGGGGQDYYIYNTGKPFSLNDIGVDQINGFQGADTIVLSKTTFASLNSDQGTGFSIDTEFETVTTDVEASTSDALIVYNSVSGDLFYNQNGSAANFGNGGQFATLVGSPVITANDFILEA